MPSKGPVGKRIEGKMVSPGAEEEGRSRHCYLDSVIDKPDNGS